MKRLRNRRAGFTLVELLVVIAIITVLIAIALPVFSRAREKARQTSCMSNLHQLAMAVRMYRMDMMHYPGYYDPITGEGGLNALYPAYVPDRRVFVCPDDPVTGPEQFLAQQIVLKDFNGSTIRSTYEEVLAVVDAQAGTMYSALWSDPAYFAEHYSSYNTLYNWMGYVGTDAGEDGAMYSLLDLSEQRLYPGDSHAFWYAFHCWDPTMKLGVYEGAYEYVQSYLHYHLAQWTYWYDYDYAYPDQQDYRLQDTMGRPLWDPADPAYLPFGSPSAMFPGLINRNAPENTIITRCANHRPYTMVRYDEDTQSGKDIVLRLDGSAEFVVGLTYDWATQPQ